MASVFSEQNHNSVKLLTVAVTSDGAGDATGSSTNYYTGEILAVVIQPSAGALAPSAAWDLTITGDNSVDVLQGMGADLSETTVTAITDCLPVAQSKITVTGANMGASNSAAVQIYLR